MVVQNQSHPCQNPQKEPEEALACVGQMGEEEAVFQSREVDRDP